MTNEVINETENLSQNENSVVEQTETVNSTEASAAQQQQTEDTPVLQNAPISEVPISQDTTASNEDEHSTEERQNTKEMDFGAILKEFEQDQTIYHQGELVEGKVVGISDRGVLVDFGYKSEGIVPIEEFTSPEGEVEVKRGDPVEVVIRMIHSGDAPPMLSREDALSRKSWAEIERFYNEELPITGRVIEKTKGGLRVDLNGVEAFLPGSQIDSRPIRNLDVYRGQDIEAKIIKFSRKRNNIVLSRKVLTDEIVNKQKTETLGQIEEGYIVEGTIKNLTEYGAFVDIGGIDGLLHVTDMSWNRLLYPNQMFKVNDTVQVKILKLDREKEKVALGYKQLLPDPWSTVTEVYPVNSKLKGKVSSVTDYGAFIELEPGVEGLVHVSEMSWSKRSKSPKKLLNAGDEIEVQVLGIDTHDRRISLGMKQLQENPWETIASRYRVGSTVRGRVRNLTDFGAFVEVEEGVDGLVHVSDISHSKKIKHPKDVLRRDQEVEAIITNIDTRERRMSLSIKELTPSAWETFITTHKPGDIVRGKVSRFAGFGVFVQLGEELEGLCHISELSDERVERPEDVVAIGQEMDFKILRIEHEDQKIGLSARAVGKEAEPTVDSKMYSTEAKGGMASLGELMNLKRGGKTGEEETKDEPKLSKKERKAQQAMEKSLQDSAIADSQETTSEDNKEVGLATNDAAETSETKAETGDENSPSEEKSGADGTFNDALAENNPAEIEQIANSSETEATKTDSATDTPELTDTKSENSEQAENIPTENLEAESSILENATENSAAENEVVNSEAKQGSEEKSANS